MYDEAPCRQALTVRGLAGSFSKRGTPIPVGRRWVVEATISAMSDLGQLRRCTKRTEVVVQAYLDLAMAGVGAVPLGESVQVSAHPLTYWRAPSPRLSTRGVPGTGRCAALDPAAQE